MFCIYNIIILATNRHSYLGLPIVIERY